MFELFQSEKNKKYYFNLKAKNGQIILASQGYSDKSSAQNGIESIQKNCKDDSKFERKTGANGKFHFNLKASNGQVIGSSQMYASESGMENGIESVKTNAPEASISDLT
ncbi:YegP family protein [Leptobacterium sp. I13]|uniref:YegP family protein n=1 Tax=Leptobacterium meishanense TaxID=3128904 RepID=UPI0030ED3DF2